MKLNWATGLPEGWRLFRISFRPGRMAGVASLSAIICILILGYAVLSIFINTYYGDLNKLLNTLSYVYFGYHLVILWILMPAMVANSMAQEWKMDTWTFQKTTPQSAVQLVLGKLAGGPADMYVALAVAFPFLALSVLLCPLSAGKFLGAYVCAVLVSVVLSLFGLYSATLIESINKESQQGVVALPVLIMIIFAVIYSSLVGGSSAFGAVNSWVNLIPISLIRYLADDTPLFVQVGALRVHLVPALLLFYSAWTFWLLIACRAQLNRHLSIVSSRLPLAGFFVGIALLFFGIFQGMESAVIASFHQELICLGFIAIYMFFLYGVIFIHSRSLHEVRPWLYQWRRKPGGIAYFFRTDSPAILTVLLLLAIAVMALLLLYLFLGGDPITWGPGRQMDMVPAIGMLCLVVIRDCLFMQGCKARWPDKIGFFLLGYGLLFIAVPGMMNLFLENFISHKVSLGLTPLAVFYWKSDVSLFLNGMANILLIAALAAWNWRIIIHAYRRMPVEL